jgi:NAD-dependent dihydropyrimidine dehydrogenase PreA subunit
MHIDLRYFSGTGNSYKILEACNESFVQTGCNTTLFSITDSPKINEKADLIGFCFPVYAFGIPRICRKYLLNLPKFENPKNAFVLITAGDPDQSGFSVNESTKILKKKGLDVTYSDVVHMPSNWTVSMNPPSTEKAQAIINNGILHAKKIAQNILAGVQHHHVFNYPKTYSRFGFFKDYYSFKWFGVSHLWRDFRTEDTCDSCGLCEKLCPTQSIHIINGKPAWSNTCEQCMRCVNYCPEKAIFQKAQGSIKHKNTYYEPTFKPFNAKSSAADSRVTYHGKGYKN